MFFLMIPNTTKSTLFPYTTLFRSKFYRIFSVCQLNYTSQKCHKFQHRLNTAYQYFIWYSNPSYYGVALRYEKADRKSTRLNSSHLVISYAVFCLKKKKIQKNRLRK